MDKKGVEARSLSLGPPQPPEGNKGFPGGLAKECSGHTGRSGSCRCLLCQEHTAQWFAVSSEECYCLVLEHSTSQEETSPQEQLVASLPCLQHPTQFPFVGWPVMDPTLTDVLLGFLLL